MEAKSTGDLSSLVEEQRLRKTEGEEEEEEEEGEEKPILPATEPPKRKNFRTDMGSSAPPGIISNVFYAGGTLWGLVVFIL